MAKRPPPTAARPRANAPAGKRGRENTVLGDLHEPAALAVDDSGLLSAIGQYTVRGILGRGGMGVVYDVEDRVAGIDRALKTVEVRFLELPETNAEQRFNHEIAVLKRLNHPGIVRMFDSGVAKHPMGYDLAYYVMEKLRGDTLGPELSAGRTTTPERALDIIAKVASALDYLSHHGVEHRDIKPGNIFVEDTGRVVLMDFGLARSGEFTRLTMTGQIVGTFSYMSPERLSGQSADIRSDVYALGVVFFQLLTGKRPFGSGVTPLALLNAIKRGVDWPNGMFDDPRGRRIKALLAAMLERHADDRPSPGAVTGRIDDIVSGKFAEARATTQKPAPADRSSRADAPVVTSAKVRVVPRAEIDSRPDVPVRPPDNDPPRASRRDPADLPAPLPVGRSRTGPSWAVAALLILSASCLAFVGGWFARGDRMTPRDGAVAIAPKLGSDNPTATGATNGAPRGAAVGRNELALGGSGAVAPENAAGPGTADLVQDPARDAARERAAEPVAGAATREQVDRARRPSTATSIAVGPAGAAAVGGAARTTPSRSAGPAAAAPDRRAAGAALPEFRRPEDAHRFATRALADGQPQTAIAALKAALAMNPAFAIAHRTLGDAEAKLGNRTAALRHYKLYLLLRPQAEDAALVRQLITAIRKRSAG